MKIYEFIAKYCADLVEEANSAKELIDLAGFAHDGLETDDSGKQVPVVYFDNTYAPVMDFFVLDKDDFVVVHKSPSAGEVYDNYVSALDIVEGADVVAYVRNRLLAERDRIMSMPDNIPSML